MKTERLVARGLAAASGMRVAVLQGPDSLRLPGWSHFLLCVGERLPVSFMAETRRAALRAVEKGAEFFPRGKWEAGAAGEGFSFAPISQAVKAWLAGGPLRV